MITLIFTDDYESLYKDGELIVQGDLLTFSFTEILEKLGIEPLSDNPLVHILKKEGLEVREFNYSDADFPESLITYYAENAEFPNNITKDLLLYEISSKLNDLSEEELIKIKENL